MTNASGPIYEVTLKVDHEIVDQFDAWLAQHIEEMSQLPGVHRAEVFQQEDDDEGRGRRIAQFFFVDDAGLEQYLAGQATVDREAAVDRFNGRFAIESRVLRHADIVAGRLKQPEVCLNCGTTLGGQYCGNCGQRAASRLISIWELLRDAFGDLLELDSRLWRTLIPLMIRPGSLTRDYLEGRRARFMPPFRMYLVLSIVFFLVAFFDPQEELGILFEPAPPATPETGDEPNEAAAVRDEIIRDLQEEGIIAADPGGTIEEDSEAPGEGARITLSADEEGGTECDFSDVNDADMPPWLASRLTPERLRLVCDRIVADDGRAFLDKLLDNVPAALFILLPLMALVLKVLYPLSKRYYVEHLLFVVHYHAFVFLILTLQVLGTRLSSLLRVPDTLNDVIGFAMAMYVPVYLYKALRRVYEQGRFFTIVKFLILTIAYFAGLIVMFGTVALFAAFSI
jgi:quinol monooxygenase YgiN